MRKKLLINIALGVASLVTVVAVIFVVATFNGWDYKEYLGSKPVVETAEAMSTKDNGKKYTRVEIINMMHDMANTLIIAEDNKIWNTVPITKESISKLLNMIKSSEDFNEKFTFTAIVQNWQKGDFTNIVNDHNTVWVLLDGTIGRANEANVPAVAKAIETMK